MAHFTEIAGRWYRFAPANGVVEFQAVRPYFDGSRDGYDVYPDGSVAVLGWAPLGLNREIPAGMEPTPALVAAVRNAAARV